MKSKNSAVIIYTKWPEIDNTKTRIAQETSQEFARDLSFACLDDIIAHISHDETYDIIFGVNTIKEGQNFKERYGLASIITLSEIGADKLTEQSNRIANVFSQALQKYDKTILIPGDIPTLTSHDVLRAFTDMEVSEYVLGPETNGGVYLIGLRNNPRENILNNVRWSSPYSFDDLLLNFGKRNTIIMPTKSDLNTMQELLDQKTTISATCPAIDSLLIKNGYNAINKNTFINYDTLQIAIPVALALIERQGTSDKEILLQLRYKPTTDPLNTGKIEIPGGQINKYEPAYTTAEREALEEAGLVVKSRLGQNRNDILSSNNIILYEPFACVQEVVSGRAYSGMAFICDYVSGDLTENKYESRKPRWTKRHDLKNLLDTNPEMFFGLIVPILKKYVSREDMRYTI
jgi:glycosyltransferase A (GT-A) superfamily protein (DUF2064 family)/8-oxo-dGTP pyrophosphatase MutT (NUDIX family)